MRVIQPVGGINTGHRCSLMHCLRIKIFVSRNKNKEQEKEMYLRLEMHLPLEPPLTSHPSLSPSLLPVPAVDGAISFKPKKKKLVG